MKREGILALDGALMWTLLQCNASPLEELATSTVMVLREVFKLLYNFYCA